MLPPRIDSKELLLDAIVEVLKDSSFNSKAPKAVEAIQAATQLHEWCKQQNNEPPLIAFAEDLVASLHKLLEKSVSRSRLNRDRMWGMYYSKVLLHSSKLPKVLNAVWACSSHNVWCCSVLVDGALTKILK